MQKLSLIFVLSITNLSGCGDPPLYETPLPNGYIHRSNGGEFGVIIKSKSMYGGPIELLAMQENGKEYWCNKFGWVKEYVVCEVIEYGENTFVDPPKSTHYLVINTKSSIYSTQESYVKLQEYWGKLTTLPLPGLKDNHASRRQL